MKHSIMQNVVLACLTLVAAVALGAFFTRPVEKPSSSIDPFSGPMVIDAPGCEINGPDGRSIKDVIRGAAKLVIPKDTTFNSDCFPAAKAAREAEYKASRP